MKFAKDRLIEAQATEIAWLRAEVEGLRGSHLAERAEWRKERQELLNRIQAPEKAVYETFEPSELQQYVPMDDDAAWHEELQRREAVPDPLIQNG